MTQDTLTPLLMIIRILERRRASQAIRRQTNDATVRLEQQLLPLSSDTQTTRDRLVHRIQRWRERWTWEQARWQEGTLDA